MLSPRARSVVLVLVAASLSTAIACGGSGGEPSVGDGGAGAQAGASSGTGAGQPSSASSGPVVSAGIAIAPQPLVLDVGEAREVTVNETFSDGSSVDVTSKATLEIAAADVAVVEGASTVRAVGTGDATMRVTYGANVTNVTVRVRGLGELAAIDAQTGPFERVAPVAIAGGRAFVAAGPKASDSRALVHKGAAGWQPPAPLEFEGLFADEVSDGRALVLGVDAADAPVSLIVQASGALAERRPVLELPDGTAAEPLALAVTPDGTRGAAVVRTSTDVAGVYTSALVVARWSSNAGWEPPTPLAGDENDVTIPPAIALDAAGNAVVAFGVGLDDGVHEVRTATAGPSGPFAAPEVAFLAEADGFGGEPGCLTLAMNAAGAGALVLTHAIGTHHALAVGPIAAAKPGAATLLGETETRHVSGCPSAIASATGEALVAWELEPDDFDEPAADGPDKLLQLVRLDAGGAVTVTTPDATARPDFVQSVRLAPAPDGGAWLAGFVTGARGAAARPEGFFVQRRDASGAWLAPTVLDGVEPAFASRLDASSDGTLVAAFATDAAEGAPAELFAAVYR